MAEILPFKGVIYNKEKINETEKVVTPPYDVISKDEQENFYRTHPYNIIRIILGKDIAGDDDKNNKYTRAAKYLQEWINDGILIKEKEDSIYIYEQKYHTKNNDLKTRRGFIALTPLQDFKSGKIFPHENTLSKPKEDRLKLMQACKGNLCQIFALYFDEKKEIDALFEKICSQPPLFDIVDNNMITNRMWLVKDKKVVALIQNAMKKKQLLIADGHHRYETALNYRNERRKGLKNFTGEEDFNYITMMFVNAEGPGLSILPTHRVVYNLKDFNGEKILKKIGEYFEIESFPYREAELEKFIKELSSSGEKHPAFGMYIKGIDRFYLLTLKNKKLINGLFTEDKPEKWKELDVAVLHDVIIENILGVSKDSQARQENIAYVKDEKEAVKKVKEDNFQIAFILNPTRVSQVKNIALKGLRMPQKSTFFYPKLLSGLVMNLFED
ncbi:MAG: hypothetical protein A2042_08720 [Candidatus Schekmanbacteria bacterium GWA2_38_11]|uniref:DUF1015 domain-containing protein n=1 Tax=Candidatus Schekmanbacteria bacterium GWA2_38_11 TaxID=1817876 RepID=A0A1F7RAN2_9BACT|nr:MAG: hypothetical protein A2042_08720 [Candidatus Schekmanbacteria bacterium GWA2_38_11]